MRVIVQFREAPTQRHFDRVQARGGTLHARLGLIKSGAFTLPAAALKDLADDDEVAFIAPDHELQTTDYLTNSAINLSAAQTAGLGGFGVARWQ